MTLRSSLQKAGLLFLGLAIAIVSIEAALHIWTPPVLDFKHVRQADPLFHHSLKASSSYRDITPEFDVEYRINAMGLRDSEYVPTGGKEFRIVMLGDSFTEGGIVPVESCFVKLLERSLNTRSGGSLRYVVFNFGVASYSPILEYLVLKEKALALKPDLVVLNFDMTDIQDDFMYGEDADFDSTGAPLVARPTSYTAGQVRWFPRGKIQTFLREKSYLVSLILKFARRLKPNQQIRSGDILAGTYSHTVDTVDGPWRQYFDRSESYIKFARELCKARGIPFVLTVYPRGHQVSSIEWAEGRKQFGLEATVVNSAIFSSLATFAKKESIPYLDMTQAFRRRSDGHLYYQYDQHWTTEGHRVAADTLLQFLFLNRFTVR